MNEVIIRAVILLLVFVLAGYLISRATKGLIRLVVIAVLTGLFLIAARSMINQILESRAANTIPQTQPPQVNVTVSPTTSPTAIASPNTAAPATTTGSDTPLQARIGLRNVPVFAASYVASSSNGQAAAAPASTPQDYQPDYQPPASQQPATQQPAAQRPRQQPITGGW